MAKESKKTQIIVIFCAFLIIIVSVLTTLFFMRDHVAKAPSVHKNVTFTDATLSCEQSITSEFESNLVNMYIDNHSSHFDERFLRYKLFFHLSLRDRKNTIRAHYVNCFVRAASGKISEFTVLERLDESDTLVPKRRFDSIQWPK